MKAVKVDLEDYLKRKKVWHRFIRKPETVHTNDAAGACRQPILRETAPERGRGAYMTVDFLRYCFALIDYFLFGFLAILDTLGLLEGTKL